MNMTINGVSLSDYGATLLSADYGYNKVTNYNDWLRGAKKPLSYGQDTTYTTATYRILVEGKNLAETDKNCSNIFSAMATSIVEVEGSEWFLDGHVISANDSNRISPLAREVEVEFEGVKTGGRTLLTLPLVLNEEIEFEVMGNAEVPAVFTFALDMGYASMKIKINSAEYEITNIPSNSTTLVLDSENGLVTLDGANFIDNYTAWKMPYLKGGKNIIQVNGAPTVKIEYNGRWM